MVRLAAETEPGPFGPNSHLTGRWFGIRRDGRLVAMAGERMRVEGFGEVSGVCVDPAVRGEGLGAVVTLAAAHGIRERGRPRRCCTCATATTAPTGSTGGSASRCVAGRRRGAPARRP